MSYYKSRLKIMSITVRLYPPSTPPIIVKALKPVFHLANLFARTEKEAT